jgi:hypothetical protein
MPSRINRDWARKRPSHLSLGARICQNRERMFWPPFRLWRDAPRWTHYREHDCYWRNALAKKLGYKAHRYCSAGVLWTRPYFGAVVRFDVETMRDVIVPDA